jgi:hypothetical protein
MASVVIMPTKNRTSVLTSLIPLVLLFQAYHYERVCKSIFKNPCQYFSDVEKGGNSSRIPGSNSKGCRITNQLPNNWTHARSPLRGMIFRGPARPVNDVAYSPIRNFFCSLKRKKKVISSVKGCRASEATSGEL